MTDLEAIEARHSVRKYSERKIEQEKLDILNAQIKKINAESGLSIKLFADEPDAFKNAIVNYGKFESVSNYFAMIGKPDNDLHQKIGYYGEKLVLLSQKLGLNTCWVAMKLFYSKKNIKPFLKNNEKCVCVIALGYGLNQGNFHRSKSYQDVASPNENIAPNWFKSAIKSALLAPTAMNQQKFKFELIENSSSLNSTEFIVKASSSMGLYTEIDLGIAKLHFEIGAKDAKFVWLK